MRMVPVAFAVFLATGLIAANSARPTLIDAAKNGDQSALRALLQKKTDVNAADADGSTALQWAAYRNDPEFADALIRAGANVNAANDLGVTPLWLASQNGSSAMVRKLLQAGANANATLLSGETPLMVAARSGYPEVVEQLLAGGADPNARGTRRPDGTDVGRGAEASPSREGAAGAPRRYSVAIRSVERSDGCAAPWLPSLQ